MKPIILSGRYNGVYHLYSVPVELSSSVVFVVDTDDDDTTACICLAIRCFSSTICIDAFVAFSIYSDMAAVDVTIELCWLYL